MLDEDDEGRLIERGLGGDGEGFERAKEVSSRLGEYHNERENLRGGGG